MGWLNIMVVKEFFTIRCEIDLNYIDLHPSNIETFGWKLGEPLIINLEIDEAKLLNSVHDHELELIGMSEFHRRGAIRFNSINAGDSKSFGCLDFMTRVFKQYLEDNIIGSDEVEEHKGLGVAASSIGSLKLTGSSSNKKEGFFSKIFG
jgi:hypothetical protein